MGVVRDTSQEQAGSRESSSGGERAVARQVRDVDREQAVEADR